MTEQIEYPTTQYHSGLDVELGRYKLGDTDIILHDWAEGTDLYTPVGTAKTVAEAVDHDGPVIIDGHFRRYTDDEDGGLPTSHHPMAGREGYHNHDDTFNQPAVLLRELDYETVDSGEDDG